MFENLFANYKRVAARLGLQVEQSSSAFRVYGTYDGVPVQTHFGTHAVYIAALWRPPSPMGLSIATTGLLGKVANFFRSGHEALGDPAFDKLFSVKADDLPRLSSLLSSDARASLLALAEQGMHPSVDDHEVRLWRFSDSAIWDSEETIEHDFRAAAHLARTMTAAFSRG